MQRCDSLRLALFSDTWYPQVNGVSRTLLRLVDAIRQRGGEALVVTVDDPGARDQEAGIIRVPSRAFWAYPELRLAWPSTSAVHRELTRFRPTIVHLATEFGVGLAGRRVARAMRTPFVSSYHTNFSEYARHYRLGMLSQPAWSFLRWFHNGGLRTYCPSHAIARDLDARGFRETRVWSRGVDCTVFSPSFRSSELRSQMNASDETLVVAYVGRLAPEKGMSTALDAMRLATTRFPGRVVFACVGDGPLSSHVREAAPAHTWLPGKLTGRALSEAYASADVFLFPSATDTFGNVLLEAMASGLPVIGADVGPTRELLGDTRGWLAPAGNAEAFANVIGRLVTDRAELARARTVALEFAATKSWDRVWDELIGDYLELHAPLT